MKKTKQQDARHAWQEFSETGAVGAYLTYRAVIAHERNLEGK